MKRSLVETGHLVFQRNENNKYWHQCGKKGKKLRDEDDEELREWEKQKNKTKGRKKITILVMCVINCVVMFLITTMANIHNSCPLSGRVLAALPILLR